MFENKLFMKAGHEAEGGPWRLWGYQIMNQITIEPECEAHAALTERVAWTHGVADRLREVTDVQ